MSYRFHAYWLVVALTAALPLDVHAKVIDYWRFDELSGLVAADSGGIVANNATWQDPTSAHLSWGPGLIGNAAVLTGAVGDNYFAVGDIEADGVTQLSYSVWVKPNLVQLGDGGGFQNKGIFTTGNLEALRSGGPTLNQFWGATWQATTTDPLTADYRFRIDATGTYNSAVQYDGSEAVPEWIHLAFTWDGTAGNPTAGDEVVKTYINGALVDTAVRNASQIINDGIWQIGRDRALNGNGRTFGGSIDDLVVWDTVLTDAQIQGIYEGGLIGDDAIKSLSLGAGVPGDVDGNGVANDLDFGIIRANFWQPLADRNQGDLYDDDFINFSDYAAWRFGVQNPPPGAGAFNTLQVPEPSSLLLICAVPALRVRRRKH
jgi:hypothetical protein